MIVLHRRYGPPLDEKGLPQQLRNCQTSVLPVVGVAHHIGDARSLFHLFFDFGEALLQLGPLIHQHLGHERGPRAEVSKG